MMHSLVIIRDLKSLLADALRQTLREVKRPHGDRDVFVARVLDIYTSSGHLLRASSAFTGTLSDFLDCGLVTGGLNGMAHDGKLKQCMMFFADAIDTFGRTVVRLSPELAERNGVLLERFSTGGQGENGDTANSSENILYRLIETESPSLDELQTLLAEIRETHDLLRRSVSNLRRMIKASYDFQAVV